MINVTVHRKKKSNSEAMLIRFANMVVGRSEGVPNDAVFGGPCCCAETIARNIMEDYDAWAVTVSYGFTNASIFFRRHSYETGISGIYLIGEDTPFLTIVNQ
jgi:hypothetical protein